MWDSSLEDFKNYLKLEKNLSKNSIIAYLNDLKKLKLFILDNNYDVLPINISAEILKEFVYKQVNHGLSARSHSRVISSLNNYFLFLQIEDIRTDNPMEYLESPKIGKKLPDYLSIVEVNQILDSINLGQPNGHRNRAILELLYGCGLRVSECISLRMGDLFFDDKFIRVIGKGNKHRLVPIHDLAIKHCMIYIKEIRPRINVQKYYEDFLFVSNRGKTLSRQMVFIIIQNQAKILGWNKKVSPHLLRHSFASHLLQNGADLRAIQQMLGHESITTTEIYVHLQKEHIEATLLKFHPRVLK